MATSAPETNSYEFTNYSLASRGSFVKRLGRLGFERDFIESYLDQVDDQIRRSGMGSCVLLNFCVTPPVMVTVCTPGLLRR